MESKQLAPLEAFNVVFQATGALQLNRADSSVLDSALRTLAGLIPVEEKELNNDNNNN